MIVSSVVPPLLPIWERVCTKLFDKAPLLVGPGISTGMPVRYENPREVGADRIVNAVAAFELMGGPVIAVDFGTATTFDCVSRQGRVPRRRDLPGHRTSRWRRSSSAPSMLHRVEIARPRSVIGRTTTAVAPVRACSTATPAWSTRWSTRIRGELGADARVIATGGLAGRIAGESATIERVEPFLTLEGLRLLFEKNRTPRPEPSRKEK